MSLNAGWGREPTDWCMFPIIGSFPGPGGRFKFEWLVFDLFHTLTTMKVKSKKVNSVEKEKAWSSMRKVD